MLERFSEFFPNEYILALVIFAATVAALKLFFIALEKTVPKSAEVSEEGGKRSLRSLSRALTVLAVFIGLPLSAGVLPLGGAARLAVGRISGTVVSASIAYLAYAVFDRYLFRLVGKLGGGDELAESLRPILGGMAKILVAVFAAVYILGIWGVEIAPLLAGLGIAGLALALALQPLLANLFNGLALVLDETFRVGDVIKLASGEMGSVYRVGLRTTKIKTFDNEMLIIPNTRLADTIVQNFFQPDKSVRVSVDFGVEYGTDPEYVKKITLEEVNKIAFTDKSQEARVLFTEMADSSLNFKTLFWVDDISKRWPAHQEAISRIYRRLYEEKIGIPFPQRTVWMREGGKEGPASPHDEKFSSVKGKYYPKFGYEYAEEEPPAGKK